MATSLRTSNYGFGKYAPDDVTSYLTDYNGTMDKIDSTIKGVSDVADEAKATADSNLNNIAGLSQGLTATNKNVENLGKAQTAQGVEIEQLQNAIKAVEIGAFKELTFTAAHSTSNMTVRMRKIGNGVQGSFYGTIDAGTYQTDRALNEYSSLLDLCYIAGNPFELTTPKANEEQRVTTGFLREDSSTVGYETAIIYYDDATNMTRVCLIWTAGRTLPKCQFAFNI